MAEYENILDEPDQDKRIEIVLTDAYGEDEMQTAFCCYLENYIQFPFEKKIRENRS